MATRAIPSSTHPFLPITEQHELNHQIEELQGTILSHHLTQLTLRSTHATRMEQVERSVVYSILLSMNDLPRDCSQSLEREEVALLDQKMRAQDSYLKSIASMVELMEKEQALQKFSGNSDTLSQIEKCKKQLESLATDIEAKIKEDGSLSEEISTLWKRLQTVKNGKVAIKQALESKNAQKARLNSEIDKLSKNKLPLEKKLLELGSDLKTEWFDNEQALKTCRRDMEEISCRIPFLTQQSLNASQRIREIQSIFIEHLKEKNIDPTEEQLMAKLSALKEKAKTFEFGH